MQRTPSTAISNYVPQPPRELRQRRSRAQFTEEDDDSMDLDSPARKLSRQVTLQQEDEMDDMSIHSSPTTSQVTTMIPSSSEQPPPPQQQQQQQQQPIIEGHYNPYTVSQIPSSNHSAEETNVFFSHDTAPNDNNLMSLQPTSFHPPPNHVYPPINTGKFINRHHQAPKMHHPMMYNSFMPPQEDYVSGRPHSMTFGASPISGLARAHSISVPGISSMNQHALMRPVGYHPSLTQMQQQQQHQQMNDGKKQ